MFASPFGASRSGNTNSSPKKPVIVATLNLGFARAASCALLRNSALACGLINGSPRRVRAFSSPDFASASLSTLSSAALSPTATFRNRSPSTLCPTPRNLMFLVRGYFSATLFSTLLLPRVAVGDLLLSFFIFDSHTHHLHHRFCASRRSSPVRFFSYSLGLV